MGFQPKSFLESLVLKPGTYSLKLMRWDRASGMDGQPRFLLEFEVAEEPSKTVVEWWGEGNEMSIRRAVQLQGVIDPEGMNQSFPDPMTFFEHVVKKLVQLSEEEKWLKAVVVVGTRQDGSPVARIRQFIGFTEPGSGRKKNEVPF